MTRKGRTETTAATSALSDLTFLPTRGLSPIYPSVASMDHSNVLRVGTPSSQTHISSFLMTTIHGIASSKDGSTLISGQFTRRETFPAPMHSSCLRLAPTPVDQWRPLPIPTDGHLELTLGDRIHGGTSGTAYLADVVSSTSTGMPPRVVVKFARQCRTLAREAWFYEQLSRESNCEGVIAPKCYGFFVGWRKDWDASQGGDQCSDFVFKPTHNAPSSESPPLWYDLADDELFNPDFWLYFCDDAGIKRESEWNTFNDDDDDGDIAAILILEVLGDFYPAPMIDEEALGDIKEIVTDLAYTGIRHYDIRHANVVRRLESSDKETSFCYRHQKVHDWRIIDFDRATRTLFTKKNPRDMQACLDQANLVGNEYFMGTLKPWVYNVQY